MLSMSFGPKLVGLKSSVGMIKFLFIILPLPEGGGVYTVLPLSVHPRYFLSHFSQQLSMAFGPKLVGLKSSVGMIKFVFIIPTVNRNDLT